MQYDVYKLLLKVHLTPNFFFAQINLHIMWSKSAQKRKCLLGASLPVVATLKILKRVYRCILYHITVMKDQGAVSRSPGNLPGPVSIFLNVFSPTRTMITDMLLGQCFYRIVRF